MLNRKHMLVDSALEKSQPEAFMYRTIQEAADAIEDGTWESPSVIDLKPDVYWTGGTQTKCGLVVNRNWLTIRGLGEGPEDTVIADARGHMVNSFPADGGANSPAQTMIVNGDGLHLENLTVGNYLNLDLVYPRDPSKNRPMASEVVTQAYALASKGNYDCWTVENCRIVGMLDTLSFHLKRLYMHNTLIEGTKDFIGGGAAAVYEDCRILIHDTCPMYMAGRQGTLYRNCRFTVSLPDFDTVYLTKFGEQLMLDHCSFEGNVRHLEWELETKRDGRCYARALTLNGEPVCFSPEAPYTTTPITEENEEAFSVLNMLGGADGWDPVHRIFAGACISDRPSCLRLHGKDTIRAGEEEELTVEILPEGTLGSLRDLSVTADADVRWEIRGTRLVICAQSEEDVPVRCWVRVEKGGVAAVKDFMALPAVTSPVDISGITVTREGQRLHLAYQLGQEGKQMPAGSRTDISRVVWYRQEDGFVLAENAPGEPPCLVYPLRAGDAGSTVAARVQPQTYGSCAEHWFDSEGTVVTEDMTEQQEIRLDDFRSFPVCAQRPVTGQFHISTYRPSYAGDETDHVADWQAGAAEDAWRYGRGRDGAKRCWGLVASARGACLRYLKGRYTGAMRLDVTLCPDKDTGEGFGSANGQYVELLIKYDAAAKTGYGLRIERRPYFANGCEFSLRRLEDGVSRVIGKAVMSCAFMPECHVQVAFDRGVLTAQAATTWEELPSMAVKKGVPSTVRLEAQVPDSGFGDMEIHHTGTVPIGNRTLIASLAIEYK